MFSEAAFRDEGKTISKDLYLVSDRGGAGRNMTSDHIRSVDYQRRKLSEPSTPVKKGRRGGGSRLASGVQDPDAASPTRPLRRPAMGARTRRARLAPGRHRMVSVAQTSRSRMV